MLSIEIAQCRLLLLSLGVKWNLTKAFKFDFSRKILKLHFIVRGGFFVTLHRIFVTIHSIFYILVKTFFIIHYRCNFLLTKALVKCWGRVFLYYIVRYFFPGYSQGISVLSCETLSFASSPPRPSSSSIWLFGKAFKQLCCGPVWFNFGLYYTGLLT